MFLLLLTVSDRLKYDDDDALACCNKHTTFDVTGVQRVRMDDDDERRCGVYHVVVSRLERSGSTRACMLPGSKYIGARKTVALPRELLVLVWLGVWRQTVELTTTRLGFPLKQTAVLPPNKKSAPFIYIYT
jgi:hypothetical protein